MGYQEVLIRSSKIPISKIAHIIQEKNNSAIESANVVATINNDFSSNKMILFGKEVEAEPLNFKAGEKFLIVCGERSAVKSVQNLFPFYNRKSIEVFPIERIMQSPDIIRRDYKEIFTDSKLLPISTVKKDSVINKLSANKRIVVSQDNKRQEHNKVKDTIHKDER